jgi:hypothetical protein
MSEQEPISSGEQPERPSTDIIKPVDKQSLLIGARWLAVIATVSLASTALVEANFNDDDGRDTKSTASYTSSSVERTHEPAECKTVKGVLRIVGVSAEQVKQIHRQDDVDEIPHMYHQRDAEGDKADVQFEWRSSTAKLDAAGVNDSAFYTAARYHFVPFTERSDKPMLAADDVAIPGNAYNMDGAVGQIVQIGEMNYCEPK